MKRYTSFLDLLSAQDKYSTAFEYMRGENHEFISYEDLIKKIETYKIPNKAVIGIIFDNSPTSLISFFALASKKQIVVLNPMDNIETLAIEIQSTHVQMLIGPSELVNALDKYLDKDFNTSNKDILFFTSGTTNKSKAVVLTEASLCNATYNGGALLPLDKNDSLLSVLPHAHVFGMVCSLLWPPCHRQ